MKKSIIIAVVCTFLFSGCGQIDESDMLVIDSNSGTSISSQTTYTTTTETHTTRNIPKTTTTTTTFLTTETVKNTEISTEIETEYNEPTTIYFPVMTTEKTEQFTTSETATTTILTTETTTTTTTKITKPVSTNQTESSWTVAQINYSSEEWYGEEFTLSAEDTKIIKDYCFGCKYEIGTCDCMGDYVFTMENGAKIYYHTDCGVFNDFVNERSYRTLDFMRDEINEILSRY